ncbi:hypothetical protein HYS97_03595 [Candidatus Daviesbacteria bacterium]|nr:hypothetical protein [Candidatus Daviesbacteria bacterium]
MLAIAIRKYHIESKGVFMAYDSEPLRRGDTSEEQLTEVYGPLVTKEQIAAWHEHGAVIKAA